MKALWETELMYMEDRHVGDPPVTPLYKRCKLAELGVALNWNDISPANLLPQNIEYKPDSSPGAAEWGYNWINATTFEVWDKFP